MAGASASVEDLADFSKFSLDDDSDEEIDWDELKNKKLADSNITNPIDVGRNLARIEDDKSVEENRQRLEEEKAKQQRKKEANSRKMRIRQSAPGLKVFSEKYFTRYKRSNLSLEKDFGYKGRPFLLTTCDLNDETIDDIFKTPWKFVLFLSPATTSPMIQNEKDYVAICEFLFYSHLSTKCHTTSSIFKKSLFAMLKNYNYSGWKLGLGHLLAAFVNLGLKEASVLEQSYYTGMLQHRLSQTGIKFNIKDELPKFFQDREEESQSSDENESADEDCIPVEDAKTSYVDEMDEKEEFELDWQGQRDDCVWDPLKHSLIRRCASTISDLVCSFPKLTRLVPGNKNLSEQEQAKDWISSLASIYVLATVASDWHLITDSEIWRNIVSIVQVILDALPPKWWVGRTNAESTDSRSQDIGEVFKNVGVFEKGSKNDFQAWFPNEVPKWLSVYDHHDNCVRRLQLIPRTFRGNNLRRMVAFSILQSILTNGKENPTLLFNSDSADAAKLLQNAQNYFNLYKDSMYVVYSVLRLLDVMIGNEPFLDFNTEEKQASIKDICKSLKTKNAGFSHITKIGNDSDKKMMYEYFEIYMVKWDNLKKLAEDGKKEINRKRGRVE